MPTNQVQNPDVTVHESDTLETTPDKDLIPLICGDNTEALTYVFRRYATLVRGVALRILRDEAEAEDLVQDLFLFIHRRAVVFDRSKSSARFLDRPDDLSPCDRPSQILGSEKSLGNKPRQLARLGWRGGRKVPNSSVCLNTSKEFGQRNLQC
jgi:hypothetical protein